MILSRTFARRYIAAGVRPGWIAAWGPVAADTAILFTVLALAYPPFRRVTEALDFPVWASVTALILLGFIPIQGVLILSSFWAARARGQNVTEREPDTEP